MDFVSENTSQFASQSPNMKISIIFCYHFLTLCCSGLALYSTKELGQYSKRLRGEASNNTETTIEPTFEPTTFWNEGITYSTASPSSLPTAQPTTKLKTIPTTLPTESQGASILSSYQYIDGVTFLLYAISLVVMVLSIAICCKTKFCFSKGEDEEQTNKHRMRSSEELRTNSLSNSSESEDTFLGFNFSPLSLEASNLISSKYTKNILDGGVFKSKIHHQENQEGSSTPALTPGEEEPKAKSPVKLWSFRGGNNYACNTPSWLRLDSEA